MGKIFRRAAGLKFSLDLSSSGIQGEDAAASPPSGRQAR